MNRLGDGRCATYEGDVAADFEAALLERFVVQDGFVRREHYDGASCLYAERGRKVGERIVAIAELDVDEVHTSIFDLYGWGQGMR